MTGQLRWSEGCPVCPEELIGAEGDDGFQELASSFRIEGACLGQRAARVLAEDDQMLDVNARAARYATQGAKRPSNRIVRIAPGAP